MYLPTKEELEEMYFYHTNSQPKIYKIKLGYCYYLFYDIKQNIFYLPRKRIFPQSKQDIETLIRILTPKE